MKSLCVIEFPGVLSDANDASAAVGALGGPNAIRAATKPSAEADQPILNLTLRPGELSCRSNIGSKTSAGVKNEFLLRITKEANGSGSGSLSPVPIVHGEIMARISTRIFFPGISDFQYFDQSAFDTLSRPCGGTAASYSAEMTSRSAAGGFVSLQNRASATENCFGMRWREKTELEHIRDIAARVLRLNRTGPGDHDLDLIGDMRPARFARTAIEMGASESFFKQMLRGSTDLASGLEKHQDNEPGLADEDSRRPSRLVAEDRRSAANRLESLPYRVDRYALSVPEVASIPMELTPRLSAVVRYLTTKFEHRPVWSRRRLLYDSPDIVRRDFKASIPHAAYSFSSLIGPFHLLWIRYGYDPRVDVEARKFQVIEIRVKDLVVLEAMRERWGSRLVQSTGEDLDVVGNHSVAELPCKRQLTLQLCDIDAPGLDDLLRDPRNVRDDFDPLNGYLTKKGIDEIVNHVKRRLRQHAVSILGDSEVQRILGQKRFGKRRKRQQCLERVNAAPSVQIAPRSEEASKNENVSAPGATTFDVPNAVHLAGACIDLVANDVEDDLDEMRRAAIAAAALDKEYAKANDTINQNTMKCPVVGTQEFDSNVETLRSSEDEQFGEDESNSECSSEIFGDNMDDPLSSLLSGAGRIDDDSEEDDDIAGDGLINEDDGGSPEGVQEAELLDSDGEGDDDMDDDAVVNGDDGGSVEGIEIFDEESDDPLDQDETSSDEDDASAVKDKV